MEILPDFIHLCNDLWMLESDAFGGCVLQGLIHQRQNGLLITQGHLRRTNFSGKLNMYMKHHFNAKYGDIPSEFLSLFGELSQGNEMRHGG